MQFNVGQLLTEPVGAVRRFPVEEEIPQLDAGVRCLSPLCGKITLLHTPGGILCTGTLQCQVELVCSRCLEPFVADICLDIEEEFRLYTPDPGNATVDDPALHIFEQNMLYADEVIRQNLLLAVPTHPLCQPGCRGLCHSCGQNLNRVACTCPEAEVDPRWSALQQLTPQVSSKLTERHKIETL